ncbi:MAG TPA: hypothetical protein VF462_11720, partial [Micromonosporaceae bacterium]
MPAVRELLDRFRPAGAPGAASAAGVPADRQTTASAELDPVFAALADVVAKCAGLRATAVRDAGAFWPSWCTLLLQDFPVIRAGLSDSRPILMASLGTPREVRP